MAHATSDSSHISLSPMKDGVIDFTAGFLGGVALVYVGQPLDTIKVKMQTFPTLHKSMMMSFYNTFKHEGFSKGIYAGTVPALVANITENSILFMAYGMCQKFMQFITNEKKVEDLSVLSSATAGSLASIFSTFALAPTELVKCKLQAMHELNNIEQSKGNPAGQQRAGPFQLTAHIFKTEGIRGLFRGLVPTLAREMPGYFFFFGGYEGTRLLLTKEGQSKDEIGLLRTMAAGAVGGCVFWASVYPIDVVKSRIQVQNINKNMFALIAKIGRSEGVRALYSGLTPTLVRTVPATATLFVTYEYSKKLMHHLCA